MNAASASRAAAPTERAATPTDATGIRMESVGVRYPNGTVGLDDVSVDIAAGDMVVVVGLSGAGKSTLIRTINGLVPVTHGRIEVGDWEMPGLTGARLRGLRSDIGMVFQSFNLARRTTVLNNVLMGRLHQAPTWRTILGAWRADDVELAMQSLERVGIVDKAYTKAGDLSGGQQQRVAIARALAQQPRVILADEPTASLDPPTSHMVMQDLERINSELGITVVVNLHFLDLATRYGRTMIGMRSGKVVHQGAVPEADDPIFREIYGRSLTADDVLDSPDTAAANTVSEAKDLA